MKRRGNLATVLRSSMGKALDEWPSRSTGRFLIADAGICYGFGMPLRERACGAIGIPPLTLWQAWRWAGRQEEAAGERQPSP